MAAVVMALCSCLILLLMANSVAAVVGERHYLFHIHTVYFNPSQNASVWYMQRTAAVLFDGKEIVYYTDGKNMASAKLEKSWQSKTKRKKSTSLKEFEGFNYLLDVSYNDPHHFQQRRGCIIETDPTGYATLLKSTAEYRLDGKVIIYFNTEKERWVAEDRKYLPITNKWDSLPQLNQVTRDYLLQKCALKLLKYCNARDKNEIPESEVLPFLMNEDMAEPWKVKETNWWLWLLMLWSIFILIVCTIHRKKKGCRCILCPLLSLLGVLHGCLLWSEQNEQEEASIVEDEDDSSDDNDDKPTQIMIDEN